MGKAKKLTVAFALAIALVASMLPMIAAYAEDSAVAFGGLSQAAVETDERNDASVDESAGMQVMNSSGEVLSGVVSDGVVLGGLASECEESVSLNPRDGFEAYVPIEASPSAQKGGLFAQDTINWTLHVWVSFSAMGEEVSRDIRIGDTVYLCYEIVDSNSRPLTPSDYGWSFTATEYIFNTDGTVRHSYSYPNSRADWISVTYGSGSQVGRQNGTVVISGDMSNTCHVNWQLYKKATTLNASGYFGTYDGRSHGASYSVSGPSDYTLYFNTETDLNESNYATAGSTTAPAVKSGSMLVRVYLKDRTGVYEDATASAQVCVRPKVTTQAYVGTYDGRTHAPTITCQGGKAYYRTNAPFEANGTTTLYALRLKAGWDLTDVLEYNVPSITDAGTQTIYYMVVPDEGTPLINDVLDEKYSSIVIGSTSVTINKATPTLAFTDATVKKTTTDSSFINVLEKTTDGVVTFSSSNTSVAEVNSSTGEVEIRGEGGATITANASAGTNYRAGSASYTLNVVGEKNLASCTVTLSPSSFTYDGAQKTPTVTVRDGSATLRSGTDYDVSLPGGRTNAGTYTVTVTGKGDYTGTKTAQFTITPSTTKDLSSCTMTLSPSSFTYDGTQKTPSVTIRDGSTTLRSGTDYDVSLPNGRTSPGTYTVTATGKDDYTGTKSATFSITDKTYIVGKDTWSFQNFDVGHNGIPIEYCQRLFGYSYGRTVYAGDIGNGGECYGMAAAAQSSVAYSKPPVSSYVNNGNRASRLFDVGIDWMNTSNNLTAKQLVLYGQIAQRDPKMLKEQVDNAVYKANVRKLSALKETVANSSVPVTLLIFPGTGGGHAVWALGISSDTSATTTIALYDSNWPNEQRDVKLFKNSSGEYTGWSFDFWWDETWGTSYNSNACISWSTPADDLQSLLDRNGKFDKEAYERELWYNRLYNVPEGTNVVASGKTYTLSDSASLNSDLLLMAPKVGMTPEKNVNSGNVLCWSNLPEEIGFTNIAKASTVSVASSNSGITANVAAGSELLVSVSDGDQDSVDIMQPAGSEFQVEYFGDEIQDVVVSGTGAGVVSTSQAGDNVVVTGASSLSVKSAKGTATLSKLNEGVTYTVMANDADGKAKVVLGDLADSVVTLSGSYTYSGKVQKPKPIVTYAGKTLKEGTDYKVTYQNNVGAGKAQVVIVGIGSYGGTKKASFTINKADQKPVAHTFIGLSSGNISPAPG